MKLNKAKPSAVHRVCIYGPPKSGKTELAGKLAEHYNLLWFDLENGHTTLFKLPNEWQERVELVHIPDSKEFPIAVETMLKVFKGMPVKVCEEHGKVSCPKCIKAENISINLNALDGSWIVVIDSGTQFTASAIAHITSGQPDTYKMDFSDWGNLKVICEKLGSQMQVAPYNLVFITHEEEVELEDKTNKIVPVLGSKNSSRNTAKYFDHVVYCGVRNKKHIVGSSTTYAMSMMTGSRTDVALENTQKDTEPSLLEIFTGYRNGNFTNVQQQDEKVTAVSSSGGDIAIGVSTTESKTASNSTVLSTANTLAVNKEVGQGLTALANLAAMKLKLAATGGK